MNITLIQTELAWEDRKKNIEHFRKLFNSVPAESQLVVLPEMFTTGFTMNPEKNAEPWDGAALSFMREMAAFKKTTVTGSVSVSDNGKYYNRLFWVSPDGTTSWYDKRHLFRMAREEQHYTAGNKKIITEIEGWKFSPLVCYDLRFPVWSRNRFINGVWEYDALIYVANWPEARIYHWKQLLIARAIEHQCYVVAVNRVGHDGNNYPHSGASMVINPRGEVVSNIPDHQEMITMHSLDKKYLDDYRKIFPAGLDADSFELTL
jgi:omega-amidase